jgi:uncharacterized protein YjbJ (UPF0337 family)
MFRLPENAPVQPVMEGGSMKGKKDLATQGTEDRLKGAAKQVEGRIRSAVGGATGNTGEQLKGKGQEIKGKAQQSVGKIKQRLDPGPGVDDEL